VNIVPGQGKVTPDAERLIRATPDPRLATQTDRYHSDARLFYVLAEAAFWGLHTTVKGGDGATYYLTEVSGSSGGKAGKFEYIVDRNRILKHAFFVVGGKPIGRPGRK
jgi:hypothetical protein